MTWVTPKFRGRGHLVRLLVRGAWMALAVGVVWGGYSAARAQSEATSEPDLPQIPYAYTEALPNYFNQGPIRAADTLPTDNPITDAGATLGRVLFYDPRLSNNNTTSCASCHIQARGFSDTVAQSIGFDGKRTERKSMGLINARYYQRGAFFWDERASSLEHQVLMPIQDAKEMGSTLAALESELAATSYYPTLFEEAFGTADVTSERIALALAQFVRSLVSYQSKYDLGIDNDFSNFTEQERQGLLLFTSQRANCSVCHRTHLQILDRPRNNGLDSQTIDPGVGGVTGEPQDDATFKAPSLRNVALRAPYMHDGRFATLDDVVAFYNNDVQNHPNLDPVMRGRNRNPRRLNLSGDEQAALVAFLETLTDTSINSEPRFSDPFVTSESPTATPMPSATPMDTPTPTATINSTPTAQPTPAPTLTPEVVTIGYQLYLPDLHSNP